MSVMDTTENPKEFLGREKACIQYIPMKLILRLAEVHRLGADKYGQKNWRVQPVRMSTYYNAMFRHMVTWFEGLEDMDPESQEHHLFHVIACALIILDGIDHSSITDDRSHAEVKTGKLSKTGPVTVVSKRELTSDEVDKIATRPRPTLKPLPDAGTRLSEIEDQFRPGG